MCPSNVYLNVCLYLSSCTGVDWSNTLGGQTKILGCSRAEGGKK